jgi:hypothetical protein
MTDEPNELLDVKDTVTPADEYDIDFFQQRGIESGHKVLQVVGVTFKPEAGESGEDSTCERRWNSRERVRNCVFFKVDLKVSELGQGGDACGHRLG